MSSDSQLAPAQKGGWGCCGWIIIIPLAIIAIVGIVAIINTFISSTESSKYRPAQSSQSSAPGASQDCSAAMMQAASVAELDNDAELIATLGVCRGTDDWILALQKNPGAGALVSYTKMDALDLLRIACVQAPEAAVCVDASEKGYLRE